MTRPHRLMYLMAFLALAAMPGCKYGLDFSGDEAGLLRDSHPVPHDETRQLSYIAGGDHDQPRIIFIHGSPGRAASYVAYLHDPIPRSEVIAVDRLGYGQSGGSAVTSFELQAAAIEPLLEKRRGQWPILVGHSLGGPIAARLAADNPDRVSGLIICAGALDPDLEELKWYNQVMRTPVALPAHQKIRNSNTEMLATKSELELLKPLLPNITCDVTVIHGTTDSLVNYENVHFIENEFVNARGVEIITIDGEGHAITFKREQEVREAIDEIVDAIQRSRVAEWFGDY